jgi:uncharacterized protein YutE (UPF0331/DUF86 family)
MVDHDLILSKANSVEKHVKRALEKSDVDMKAFLNDSDRQDIVLFNLQMAVQNCIDIAAHIISDEGFGVPGSNNEMFYMLEENGYLEIQMVEKMVKAIGFRNLIVHEYGELDIEKVYEISRNDIKDLLEYLKAVFKKVGLYS